MLLIRSWRLFLRNLFLAPRKRYFDHLRIEQLEDRLVPAMVTWTNPGSGNWDVGANWSTGNVPGAGDNAVINTQATGTITIQSDDAEAVDQLSLASNDTLSFTGGTLTIGASSTLNGALSMTGGAIIASGGGVAVTVSGSTSISDASLYAKNGATLSLPNLTSYSTNGTFQADGSGSLLNLSALTTITQPNGSWNVDATNGGVINLSGMSTLIGTNGISITDTGGSTLLNNLTSLNGVDVTLDGTDTQVANNWASFTDGSLTVTVGSYSLPNLTDIDGSSISISTGGGLALLGVTSYTDPSSATSNPSFEAAGSGSALDVSHLTAFGSLINDLSIDALNGGQINLSSLSAINGEADIVSIETDGSNSEIDLADLTSVSVGYCLLQVTDNATIMDGGLTTMTGVHVMLDGTGTIATSQWTALNNGSLTLTGGSLTLSDINVDGSSLTAESGGQLSLPSLTSWSSTGASEGFGAEGQGSVLDLPSLTTLGNLVDGWSVGAVEGGQVNLSSLETIDSDLGYIAIDAYGENSQIDLSALTSLTGTTGPEFRGADSALKIEAGGTILDGNLTSLTGVAVTLSDYGSIDTSQWTALTGGSINVSEGGSYTFPALTDLDGSSLWVQGNGGGLGGNSQVDLPALMSFNGNGSSVEVIDNGVLLTGNLKTLSNVNVIVDGTGTWPTSEITSDTKDTYTPLGLLPGNAVTIDVPVLPQGLQGSLIDLSLSGTYTGGTTINVPVSETVDVSGTVSFTGGIVFSVVPGALINLNGGETISGTVTGSGGGSISLNGSINIGLGGMTLNFPGNMFQWTAGAMYAALGNVTNQGTIILDGSSDLGFFEDATFYNYGTMIQTGSGNLDLHSDDISPTTLINETGAYYLFDSNSGIDNYYGGQVAVANMGTIRKTAGTGTSDLYINGPLNNTGTIEADAGTLYLNANSITQLSGSTLSGGTWNTLDGATLEFPTGTAITNNAGNLSLSGSGATMIGIAGLSSTSGSFSVLNGAAFTTAGDLSNTGTLSVGGTLNIGGNFTQTSTGTFDEQIGGSSASSQFGQTGITGSANLAGTFNLDETNNYGLTLGENYVSLTFAAISGTFTKIADVPSAMNTFLTSNAFVVGTSANPPDLVPVSVTAPITATAGHAIIVNWQVDNESSNAATGNWQDSVYLSTAPTITSTSILLGAVLQSGGLAANASYIASLSATLPAQAPGNYYILVQVDSLFQTGNENYSNDILAATTGPLSIGVPALTLGSPTSGSFTQADQNQYYQVTVPAGGSLQIALTSAASSGSTALYVSQGTLSTAYNAQESSAIANQPDQTVTVPQVQSATTYYILVQSVSGEAATAGFTLTATQITDLAISSISLYSGGNGGNVTIEIEGANFTPNITASLTLNGTTISATTIDYVSASQIYGTFDLNGVAAGAYTLKATSGAKTATAPASFQVEAATNGALGVSISTPEYIRSGRTGTITITYTNETNDDIVAPLLDISSSNTSTYFSTPDDPNDYTQNAQVLAAAPSGPAGILLPGQSGQLTLMILSNDTVNNDTIPVQESQIESGETLDWASQESSLQPPSIPTAAWNVIWSSLMATVGTTTDSYNAALAQAATYLGSVGESTAAVCDVQHLWEFLLDQADASLPTSTLGSTTDASLPTPGDLSLAIDRTFNSSIAGRYNQGIFGLGWSSSWEMSLSEDTSGNVSLYLGGAQASALLAPVSYFVSQANGDYLNVDGEYGTLADSSGVFTYTDPAGIQYVFFTPGTNLAGSPGGRLNYVQDTNGNRITLAYNSQDQLNTLSYSNPADPSEPTEQLTLTYNEQGFVSQVADGSGDVWTYAYDAAGHLLSVTAPGNLTTAYTYDTSNNGETANALLSVTNPDGAQQNFAYDPATGRLVGTSANGGANAITYTYPGEAEVTASDANGAQTIVWFNDFALPARIQDPLGGLSTYVYDNNGNLINYTDAGGNTYQYRYDGNGNLTQMVDPLGQTAEMTYGPLDTLTSLTDVDDNTTQYSYGATRNLLGITYPDGSQQSFSYDPLGNMTDTIEQNGDPVCYEYNAQGLVTEESFADGSSQTFTYDAHGNLLTASSFDMRGTLTGTTTLTYNSANELLSIGYPNGQFLDFTYNAQGQRVQSVDQSGYSLTYTYDALGRLTGLSDGSGMVVSYTYNDLGELSGKTNGNGTYTTYAYDAAANLINIINYAPDGSVADPGTAINSSFIYTYNLLNEQTSETDNAGNTTTYSYDATGQLIGVGLPGGQAITYVYNAAGDRTEVIDNGTPTTYASNSENEITQVGSATYTCDANGNLQTMTDVSGTTTYTYNDLNQLVSIANPDGSVQSLQYSPLGFMVGTSTTSSGTTTQTNYLVDPTGLTNVVASYSGSGALVANYVYGLGLVSQTGPSGTGYYDFDASGNTMGITGAAGTYVNQYSYLPFGETTTVSATLPNPFTFVGQFGVLQIGSSLFNMGARNYSSVTGQFLSNDPIGLAGGDTNIRRYAGNNPVTYIDPQGLDSGATSSTDQAIQQIMQQMNQEGQDQAQQQMQQHNEFSTMVSGGIEPDNNHQNDPELSAQEEDDLRKRLIRAGADFSYASRLAQPKYLQIRKANDPNTLVGPTGYSTQDFILDSGNLPYTIDFENDGSVAADDVTVTEQLSSNLDWSTFQLGSFGFGSLNISVPAGLTQYQTTVSCENSDGTSLNVLVSLLFNVQTGLLTAAFTSLDPASGEAPTGVFDGFLYPESVSALDSDGFVQYTVQPKSGLTTGADINQQASVVFDTNGAINTETVTNTIDITPPISSIKPLPIGEPSSSFTVSWSGSDPNGIGIASYSIYVSVNGGAFTPWLTDTTETSATYTGIVTDSYSFYSIATNDIGLVQPTPSGGQAATAVPGPVDPANSLITLSLSPIQFDGVITITLQARDAEGNNEITGDLSSVVFALENKSGAKGTFSKVTNNKNGTYTATFTGTLDGENTIIASATGTAVLSTQTIGVEGAAVSLADSTATVGSSMITAGTTTLVTLQAEYPKDIDEPAGGLTVAFKLGSTTGGQGTFSAVTYNGNGQYSAILMGTLAGRNTIKAYIDGQAVSSAAPSIDVQTGPLSLAHSPLTLSAASMKANGTITLTWQPEDAGGNKLNLGSTPLPVFYLASGTGSFGTVTYNKKTYTYSASFTTITAGSYTIETSYNNQPVTSNAPTLTVLPQTASVAKSTVTLTPTSTVVSGQSITVTLQTADEYDNLETTSGLAVAFKLAGGSGQGTFGKVTYIGNGKYQATFTGTIAGSNTIEATIAGVKVASTQAIAVTPGPYSLSKSVVTVSPPGIVKSGGTITVYLQTRDAAGNDLTTDLRMEGVTISFELGIATGHEGTFGAATYLSNGRYEATFSATSVGTNTVVALMDDAKVTSTAPTIRVTSAL